MSNAPIYNKSQYEFLLQLYAKGYTIVELAEWVNVYPGTIRENFYRHGLRYHLSSERPPLSQYTHEFVRLGGDS